VVQQAVSLPGFRGCQFVPELEEVKLSACVEVRGDDPERNRGSPGRFKLILIPFGQDECGSFADHGEINCLEQRLLGTFDDYQVPGLRNSIPFIGQRRNSLEAEGCEEEDCR